MKLEIKLLFTVLTFGLLACTMGKTKDNIETQFISVNDDSVLTPPKDSGKYKSSLKTGAWTEYLEDSSSLDTAFWDLNGKLEPLVLDKVFYKLVGNYKEGKKNGLWTTYSSSNDGSKFLWTKNASVEYLEDRKSGADTVFQGRENNLKPLIVCNWENDKNVSLYEIYNPEYPFSLQQRYRFVNGQAHLLLENYRNGTTMRIKVDTIIGGDQVQVMKSFEENGSTTSIEVLDSPFIQIK